ncbi:ECF transporter S component [Acetobacterium bakii]|uniref:Riboflavin transporter n=1 Tax=Acetobacterium bakii TaxID=52689 RepID=A0A0L6U1F3_9FIRM|nr:ECF transporter S component [Acetobacterium bakii]KNZ42187.1 membrane protein [Acetobacterium bakii]
MKIKTKQLTQMAVLAAMSILLVYLIRFPIFPTAPFLEYDPADIPIFIGAFLFGPVGGLILTGVVCVLQGLTVSSASGVIGILMHFFATGSFVLVAGIIYKKNRTRKGAVIGLSAGVVVMTITMILWNIVLTPFFLGIPVEAVLPMILPIILPFNIIKAGANAAITFMVYKSVGKVLGLELPETKIAETEVK